MTTTVQVRLEPWSAGDLDLLQRTNAPEMTAYLGGPETERKLLERHRRYLQIGEAGRVFRIVLAPDGEVVGTVVFWEREWQGQMVWEIGWAVLPEFQGRGIAAAAASAAVDTARAEHRHRYLHAFPSVAHAASNGVCRKVGFELLGEVDFEYPVGRPMRCHDWRLDLERA